MKKLVCAAMIAASMFVMAEEAATKPAEAVTSATTKSAEAAKKRPARPSNLTAAQRAEMKARRERFIAERKAAMEAKLLVVVKKYVDDDEKAKALVKELEETVMANRRARPNTKRTAPKAE